MFKGLGDMGKMLAQAKEMQEKALQMQQQLETIEVQGSAGAGMVTAIATAKGVLKGVRIDPSLIVPGEAEMLEDLIVAAVRDAQDKAAERAQEEMQKLTADMPIPPGMEGMLGGR